MRKGLILSLFLAVTTLAGYGLLSVHLRSQDTSFSGYLSGLMLNFWGGEEKQLIRVNLYNHSLALYENGKHTYGKILVQVKGGAVHRDDIATLKGDIEREKASGGLLLTLENPTRPMQEEVASAGSYSVNFTQREYPKIQILTIEDLLNNKSPDVPLVALPYHKEAKEVKPEKQTEKLF